MGKKKITYIISDIDKALAFEWIAAYLDKEKFELSFILLNPGTSVLEHYLQQHRFRVHRVLCRGKKDWLPAIHQTYKLLKELRPDAVHCHLIQANIIGLAAAKLAGIKKRIYTRHHSSLHHVYFPKGVWWDKLANRLATHIVAISGIVKDILLQWEKVPAEKISLIPHGFLLEGFRAVEKSRVDNFRNRHEVNGHFPVVGVISRFTEWKGVQYIIPAFKELLHTYPKALLLLLNAHGDYEQPLLEKLANVPVTNYRLIPFEKDVAAAYQAMDVFVHVPVDEHSEAFGQIYVESLAAGIPAVFTRSGIANEPFYNDEVAVMVTHKSVEQVKEGIITVLQEKEKTRTRIGNGRKVAAQFSLPVYIEQLESLYST